MQNILSHVSPRMTLSIALLGLVAGSVILGSPLASAEGTGLHYSRGYSVQGSWLCYGWPSGAYHCTQHWYRAGNGTLVSTNPGWVPNVSGQVSSSSSSIPTTTSATTRTTTVAPLSATVSRSVSPSPAGISQWAYTGRTAYPQPRGTFQGYTWGYCTSGAAMLAHDNVSGLGWAMNWTRAAAARGMPTGVTPRVGATVVYQPGVQGASTGGGHVAHVAAVYANGWFLSEDVNFYWNGGGYGMVSFRYAHAGAGVSFIY